MNLCSIDFLPTISALFPVKWLCAVLPERWPSILQPLLNLMAEFISFHWLTIAYSTEHNIMKFGLCCIELCAEIHFCHSAENSQFSQQCNSTLQYATNLSPQKCYSFQLFSSWHIKLLFYSILYDTTWKDWVKQKCKPRFLGNTQSKCVIKK